MDAKDNVTRLTFGRHEFLTIQPEIAIPILFILGLATLAGTLGNGLILVSVATRKSLHNVESIFIVNLACSDLYVTALADPMSIIAKLEGSDFFDRIPGLCRVIGSLCTMSCVASLMTIAAMSCNRYVFIVHHSHYKSIFSTRNCVIYCVLFYCVGMCLVLLNLADIGGHSFDHKSLECIWERMATYPYTVVFSVVMVWIPIGVTGISYLRIYQHVRAVRSRVHNARATHPGSTDKSTDRTPDFKLAKTLFIIYIVFSVCWIPYALLIVLDSRDTFQHELHVFIVVFAHLHPSINWLVYYATNRKFHSAFIEILGLNKCVSVQRQATLSTTMQPPQGSHGNGRTDIAVVTSRNMTP
ncbi:melatonin receptor type 1B-B-like [Haliotis rufescens]|uniref:melatonin receptor type 1B-B-like n=1 Tax=Haliotis rufescens TaxID=6454 RepID=UPI00201F09F8|nr:melatonin receptor type 1B-B-like [Haliotis rufescens]